MEWLLVLVLNVLELAASIPSPEANGLNDPASKAGAEQWTDPFTYPNGTRKVPPITYKDGPMPTISDSLFSLIILIYVGVIFVFMFFAFCWKEPDPPPPDPAHKNIPMITSMLEEMEKQEAEAKALAEAEAAAAELVAHMTGTGENGEVTEMKDLSNDNVNVISEKNNTNTASEAATSV